MDLRFRELATVEKYRQNTLAITFLSVMVFPSTLKEGLVLGDIALVGNTDLIAFQNLSGEFKESFSRFL